MSILKQQDGRWLADFYIDRENNKRIRRKFSTKGEALAFESYYLEKSTNKEWLESKTENRSLIELIDLWYSAYGITLKGGDSRVDVLKFAAECMGYPSATEFDAKLFSRYRQQRLSGKIYRTERFKKVAPRTLNIELSYFKAVFNELIRLGEWSGENPLSSVRPFKTDEQEMSYLTKEQILRLLKSCNESSAKDLSIVVKICLSTGARWSEAEQLKSSQVKNGKITYIKTKGRRNRSVPVSDKLLAEIPKKEGLLFTPCYSAFRSAIKRAEIILPDRQLTHVLRHTFASHFMMKGGNILVLQRILGHTDIKMTMRYSHFAPDHLDDAIKLNPLQDTDLL